MALPKIVADLETSLTAKIAVAGTTGTIASNVDDDGVTLADGTYYFTIDGNNSAKEHIKCTKTGTALSDIYSVSRQGVETSGTVREHRVGAKVIMTDYATYKNYFEAAVGDVNGPASSTDNAIARYDSTTGKIIQNSDISVFDKGSTGTDEVGIRPQNKTGQGTHVGLFGGSSTDSTTGAVRVKGGEGYLTNSGGNATLQGGEAFGRGAGGYALVQGGAGGATSGNGGVVIINGGIPTQGNAGYVLIQGGNGNVGNGSDIILSPGTFSTSGANGKLKILGYNGMSYYAILDATTIATSDKTFTFPNRTGTLDVYNVTTTTDDSTAVIDVDTTDTYELSAIANATTFSTTGTPRNGQRLVIRLRDAGVAKGLTWDAVFVAIGVTLPTTTVAGKWHYVGCQYNSAAVKWHALAVGVQA